MKHVNDSAVIRVYPVSVQEMPRVNVFPLVNLFLMLIPFLLLCASFAPLASAAMDLPATASNRKEARKVMLTVTVRPNVVRIEARSDTVSSAQLRALDTRLPRDLDDHSAHSRVLLELSQTLNDIKQRYPTSDTVALLPDDSILYEDVVAIMDVLRDRMVERGGLKKREPLFPLVILGGP